MTSPSQGSSQRSLVRLTESEKSLVREFAELQSGRLTTDVIPAVRQAIADGVLAVSRVSTSTLYRLLRDSRVSWDRRLRGIPNTSHQPQMALGLGPVAGSKVGRKLATASLARATSNEASNSPEWKRLQLATKKLQEVVRRIQAHRRLTAAEFNAFRKRNRWGRPSEVRVNRPVERLRDKASETEALVRRFKEVLQEIESEVRAAATTRQTVPTVSRTHPALASTGQSDHGDDPDIAMSVSASSSLPVEVRGSSMADELTSCEHSGEQNAGDADHGVYSTDIFEHQNPALDTREKDFEERVADDSGLEYGEKIGKAKLGVADQLALFRMEMVAPVINGIGSVPVIAAAWRDALQRRPSIFSTHVIDWPEHIKVRFAKLPERSLRRWANSIKKDQQLAMLTGTPPKSWLELLRQKNTGPRTARKATPQVIELIRDIWLSNEAYTAALVALTLESNYDIKLSDRWVQKIISTEITDEERAEWRAGPAATDVIFRKRLLRQSPYPNRAWIIDHSYVHQTTTAERKPVDFEMHVREKTGRDFKIQVFLWMTAIVDACTGRTLIIRLHARQPDTTTTLMVLVEAIEKFGAPEILYSDNGSDLVSGQMRQALAALGIQQVCSMPYTPEGRGMIERKFRTIKEGVFPALRGYQGNGKVDLAPESLLTVEEVEKKVEQFVERRFNSTYNEQRRCVPIEKFDREVKGRRLLSSTQRRALMMALMVKEGVVVTARGVRYKNDYYWGDCITAAVHGMKVNLHAIQRRPLSLRLSTYTDGRADVDDCSYIGVVSVTNDEHPAPSYAAQKRMESRFRQSRRAHEPASTSPRELSIDAEPITAARELALGCRPKALLASPISAQGGLSPSSVWGRPSPVEDAVDGGPESAVEQEVRSCSAETPPRRRLRKSYEEA